MNTHIARYKPRVPSRLQYRNVLLAHRDKKINTSLQVYRHTGHSPRSDGVLRNQCPSGVLITASLSDSLIEAVRSRAAHIFGVYVHNGQIPGLLRKKHLPEDRQNESSQQHKRFDFAGHVL